MYCFLCKATYFLFHQVVHSINIVAMLELQSISRNANIAFLQRFSSRYCLDSCEISLSDVCKESAKFGGSHGIVGLLGTVPIVLSCLRGYFMGRKFFNVGIFGVQLFFSWEFRGSETFSRILSDHNIFS